MGLVARGTATDFWHRYEDDIRLAAGLGCRAFRFSIAWSRVEPEPGVNDEKAWGHYQGLIDTLFESGLEPVVTLHHYTWPLHVEARGGLSGESFPDMFAAYAEEAARRLGARIRYWLTFNEPNMLVYGYLKPWWQGEYLMPPGLPAGVGGAEQMDHVRRLMRNLFLANARARAAIKGLHPDALVGTNPLLLGLPAWLQGFLDWSVRGLGSESRANRQGRRLTRRPLAGPGDADLVAAAMSVTPDRGTQVDFSRVYRTSGLRLLTLAGQPAPAGGGLDVAVVAGSTAQGAAPEVLPDARVHAVPDYEAGLTAVAAGRVGGLLGDEAILAGVADRSARDYEFAGPAGRPERYAAAVAKSDGDLLAVVNAVVEGDGEAPAAAAGPALRRIRRRGHLIAGVLADVPGLGFRDPETGEWSGAEVELCRSVAERILGDPSRVVFEPVTTRTKLPRLRPWSRFLDPVLRRLSFALCALNGNWWHLGMAGRLPTSLCPEGCAHQQDFVGVDYYWGVGRLDLARVHQLSQASAGHYADAPVWPPALGRLLRRQSRMFGGLPLLVAENGCVETASGVDRVEYLQQHLRQVRRAVRRGVPVIGYICWTVTSNREWGLPFGPGSDFGLYGIALDTDPTLTREPRPAALAYREIISRPWP